MLHSKIFVKSKKEDPTDEVSKNAILLHKASYIYKEMAGVYSYLPFGLRTLTKIENLVRKHMDKIGNEIFMSSLAPKELWETTKRIDTVDVLFKASAANEFSKNKSGNEYILNSTHEELVTPIAIDFGKSYKDFPLAYYQIQTKFRNEPRVKSGLLRGREFRMKDLYSFHIDEQDFLKYYEEAKNAYMDFYHDVGLGEDTFIASASGGDFTQRFSHEFQTLVDAGEDVIYIDREKKVSYNKEVVSEDAQENIKNFGYDVSKLPLEKACEVGNIFPLESKFTKAFNFQYTDKDNQKKLVEYMGCYGIGPSRVMGVLVEKFG
jgi:prolyl-tRNA synthetase